MPRRDKNAIAKELLKVRATVEPLLAKANALCDELRTQCEQDEKSFAVRVPGKGTVECQWRPSARAVVNVTLE